MSADLPVTVTLETKIEHLSRPESYPDHTSRVKRIYTHMSCVFVTDEFVYKMKKPIGLPFLDFRELADRKHFCEESLRLNRRLAATVYLGVIPLTLEADNTLQIDGIGQPVEWLEKMRRLPDDLMLDHAIANHQVSSQDVCRFAEVLVNFYQLAAPVKMTPERYCGQFLEGIELNRSELTNEVFKLDKAMVEATTTAQLEFIQHTPSPLHERAISNMIIEAHGDLRPEHVCLSNPPVFIDCLEFDRNLRLLDKADELAYLAMECEFVGDPFIGPVLFSTYEERSGDSVPQKLKHFYQSHRAVVRARLAAWHIKDHPESEHARWLAKATNYIRLGAHHAEQLN
jgi:aminoglycoside phosphotransferase family enzyme